MRDIALARLTGAPRALPAPVDRRVASAMVRAGQGRGPAGHRRGDAAPLHPDRRAAAPPTTRCSRSTRRCAPPPTSTAVRGRRWPTAPSTPSPPTTPRTRRRRKERAVRPGAARDARASRRRWRWRSPSCRRWPTSTGCAAGAAVVAAGGHRRPRRAHGGPRRAGRAGQPLRHRPDRGVGGRRRPRRPAGAATRPTPGAGSAAGSATPSSRGEPVVVDGEATR